MRRPIEERAANAIGRVGERLELDTLIYNPLRMHLFHLAAAPYAGPFAAAVRSVFPEVHSVVDVGCGSGVYAAAFARAGTAALACERSRVGRAFAAVQGVDCRSFDLNRQPPTSLPVGIELAYCVEVAEHLPPALGDRLVSFLSATAPIVVFTAAPIGQGGTGHINEQPMSYWEQRFSDHGLFPETARTAAVREHLRAAMNDADVLAGNLCIFTVPDS